MAKQETLQAEKREVKGTTASKRLRRTGIVPAVIYGSSQREYTIQLDSKAFFDLAKQQGSQNFLVTLEIEGAEEKSKLAIVQDIQRDPLSGQLIHVDFRAVSENETIHATVPIALHGEPEGVKGGGILEQLLHEIEVLCRPGNLPDAIDNDIESLKLGDSLKVSELNLPEGVTVRMDGDVLVAVVAQPRLITAEEEAAEAEAAGEAAGEPAVVGEEGAEGEGEEAGEESGGSGD
ncbi:MAG: 50S ribosomal protein L25 [Verrucomicrobiales bacterium]